MSQPRNAVIANVFYRLELIESYGTDIQKMLESYTGLSREENILRLMAKQGAVTRKDVEQFLGCSSFPANKALAGKEEQGKIVKTGTARGTKYVLKYHHRSCLQRHHAECLHPRHRRDAPDCGGKN